jgi:hypothetical protein
MKKVILIFLAAIAFSCGDGSNRSSESGTGSQTEQSNDAALEADTTNMQSDTTSSPGMDRESRVDTVSNNNNNP